VDWVPPVLSETMPVMTEYKQAMPQANKQDLFWASRLVECMNELGEMETNVVLMSIDDAQTIKPFQRYPETPYYFADKHWRAFYHCHDAPDLETNEHGHYHFFTRTKKNDNWSHVVAMGMNNFGQPIRMFTTNLWVTDGHWFEHENFFAQVSQLCDNNEYNHVTNWLKYCLLLFQNEINDLLQARDRQVELLYPNNHDQCFKDRSIYYLSGAAINLRKQLTNIFQSNRDK